MEYQTIAWESMDQSLLLQEEVFGVISKKNLKEYLDDISKPSMEK